MSTNIIVCVDSTGGFGWKGEIPWFGESFMAADLKHFQTLTTGGICVMGRVTAEEIDQMNKKRGRKSGNLLGNRDCYVMSSNTLLDIPGSSTISSMSDIPDSERPKWILGGDRLFVDQLPTVDNVYMTKIKSHHTYQTDRVFDVAYTTQHFSVVDTSETDDLYFIHYTRKN